MATECNLPVGRIVWGHPNKATTKKQQDGPTKGQPVLKDGQPVQQWTFGLAIPRADFERDVWPLMAAEAAAGYPQGIPQRFSWKFKDGDSGIDGNGKPYNLREGYAGHIVLTISTEAFAPTVVRFENGSYRQLAPEEIKCGDYVAGKVSFAVNVATGTHTPSLYVNPIIIDFVGYGKEIVSQGAVDPMQALGGRTYALPPGASAAPMQAQPGLQPPGMPGASAVMPPMAQPGGMPSMPGAPAMTSAAPALPPPPPAGPQRPTDPSHIAHAGTPSEQWWNGTAWVPALPPPATDFIPGAPAVATGVAPMPGGGPAGMPGMPFPR